MPRTRLSAAIYLILVFASGILVGIVSYRLYMTTTASASVAPPKNMNEYKHRYLADMQQKVGINDAQREAISRILDDTKRKFDDLHASEKPLRDRIQREHLEQIRALLDDRQRAAFDKWHDQRMKAAKPKTP